MAAVSERPQGEVRAPDETYDQWYWRTIRKFKPRKSRRKNQNATCALCGILLISRFAGKGTYKYCRDCLRDKKISRKLYNLYLMRSYRKRVGAVIVPEINIHNILEKDWSSHRRKLVKMDKRMIMDT